MLSFFRRSVPASGRVLFAGAIPPPFAQFASVLDASVGCTSKSASPDQVWAAELTHPNAGSAEIICVRNPPQFPPEIIDVTLSLSEEEKVRAHQGDATIGVRVRAEQQYVLRDRKRLLFWLRMVMRAGGVIACDDASTLFWSEAMLDDELAHDADLDIESLYALHAVQDSQDSTRVSWLHTHGLEELGAFDFDALQPSPAFVSNCADPMRALGFAALEGNISVDTDRFPMAYPGGDVRLVSVERFHADAAPEHKDLRQADDVHSGRRSVLCEPVGGLFRSWRSRPAPSRFISSSSFQDGLIVSFSESTTKLMAERAQATFDVFRRLKEEFESLELPALVKLRYAVDDAESTNAEHLWFNVHRVLGATVDATLINQPHHVASLTANQRGEFELERLTDWVILSPEGQMTPRNVAGTRRLRANREEWQARLDAAKQQGS
jgi:uncharacterized protein YegJ (DUF2314 family)